MSYFPILKEAFVRLVGGYPEVLLARGLGGLVQVEVLIRGQVLVRIINCRVGSETRT